MTGVLDVLIASLSALDWTILAETHKRVESLLQIVAANRKSLGKDLLDLSRKEQERVADFSVETPTHYKWHVFKEAKLGYRIWLHEYKSTAMRRPGYAEVPHNHRYWFSSLILKGGFKNEVYEVMRSPDDELKVESVKCSEEQVFPEGTVYTVDPATIHSLSEIMEPTLTLIVRSKETMAYSEAFNKDSPKITRYYSFASRIKQFDSIIDLI